jgi:hypothetical protein
MTKRTLLVAIALTVFCAFRAPIASADVTEVFYVSGTFTNLLGAMETVSPSSTVAIDITTGKIESADISVPGATFTGNPVDILNSYSWSNGSLLDLAELTLDIPPLLSNNLVNFKGGPAAGVLVLPTAFGVSGSDTLTLAPAPEPASVFIFGTGLLAVAGLMRRRSNRQL